MAKSKPKRKSEKQIRAALVAAAKKALKRLQQLGAEDEPYEGEGEKLGPCPACEALRKAIKDAEA